LIFRERGMVRAILSRIARMMQTYNAAHAHGKQQQ
jgi:hypothetical protein